MMLHLRRTLPPAAVLGLFLAAGTALAADAPVTDSAGFFSPAAVQKANEGVREIRALYHKNVVIETFPNVPGRQAREVQGMDRTARDRFFDAWAKRQMQQGETKDIYVLICKSPGHVQIGVDEQTLKKAFTLADRDKLRDQLVAAFKEKKYDQGLLDSVRFIRERLETTLPARLPAPVVNKVEDRAGFFDAATIQKADRAIKEINQQVKKNLVIETFKTPPPGKAQQVQDMSREARERFFASWLKERARESGTDGIYVLICKQPGHVQIGMGPETEKKGFTPADRDKVEKVFLTAFREKRYDQGLLDALALVDTSLRANLGIPAAKPPTGDTKVAAVPPASPPDQGSKAVPGTVKTDTTEGSEPPGAGKHPSAAEMQKKIEGKTGFSMIWVVAGLVGLIVLWVFIGILRALFGSRRPPAYPQAQAPHPSQGGGGPGPQQGGSGYAGQGYGSRNTGSGSGSPPMGSGPGYGAGRQAAPVAGPASNAPYGSGPYYAGPPGGGGGQGGGFMSGMLGGMFGAAAGNWIYDSFRRPTPQGPNWSPSPAPGSQPVNPYSPASPAAPSQGSPAYPAAPTGPDSISTTGGDFDEPAVSTTGGDFGDDADQRVAAAGSGDFGQQEAASADAGTAGDFDADAGGNAAAGGGGDFGAQTDDASDVRSADASADYDAGADSASSGGAGGDFGGSAGADTGGDFGGTDPGTGGGDFGGADAGAGGDSGGGDASSSGGDGGGTDTGAGSSGGGDF